MNANRNGNGSIRLPAVQAAAPGAFRRAVERHRAERAAWQRVLATRAQWRDALADYEAFCSGDGPLLSVDRTINGLKELADELTMPEPELPAGGEPRVEAFVAREKAERREKRRAKKEKPPVPPPPADLDSWCDLHAKDPVASAKFAAGMVADPSDPALDRLGQLLDSTLPDRQADGLPPWTSQDLDTELLHALGDGGLEAGMAWGALIRNGATNAEIDQHLGGIWPRSRRFVGPSPGAGRRLGYTVIYATSQPVFWLGAFREPGHKPTLANGALINRIRTVLEIPTPAEARKRAQDSFREPKVSQRAAPVETDRGDFIPKPLDGWDEPSTKNAMEDLGLLLPSQVCFCSKCEAIRPRWVTLCPSCGWNVSRDAFIEMIMSDRPAAQSDQPAKRGRGRPPGSKTRKAVEA